MLDHSKVNTEISDTGIETTGSNDCKEMSRDNRDTNGIVRESKIFPQRYTEVYSPICLFN